MQRMNRLVLILTRQRLRLLHRLLCFLCELIELNHCMLQGASRSSPLFGQLQFTFTYFQPFTSIFTCRGLAASFFGSLTVRTPFLNSAPTFSGSTVAGTVKLRVKDRKST